jgi:hypothetical protein
MNLVIWWLLLAPGDLRFEACDDRLDVAVTQGIVSLHGPKDHPEVRVRCDESGGVRVQTQRSEQTITLSATEPALRPQLIALAVLGTLADLKTLPPIETRGQSAIKLRLAGGFAVAFTIVTTAMLAIGLSLTIAAGVDDPNGIRPAGLALSIGSAVVFPAAAVPFGFWLYESALPKLAW